MTPPETYRLPADGDWRVRVVPNLYPAFERHEVIVHVPRHARSLGELDDAELADVAATWRARAEAARAEGFPYVQAILNEGRDAGASLAHTHSQLVGLREEPPVPARERALGTCGVCRVLAEDTALRVSERDGVVCLAPAAGRAPYELLVAPLEHEPDGFPSPRLETALQLLGDGLRRLGAVEGPTPANAWLHTRPRDEDGHWHVEVLPRLTILAGLELGSGIYVNTLPPDEAARALRSVVARP